ncbi:hypothetical protein [uncultured Flavobacterium sp.]|nr:hypothetical protein [uncultured Flavobacterium sp.]
MVFTAVNLKKHLGKTLPQILFADLDYFIWAYENVKTSDIDHLFSI